ncbi:hypothetical protein [Methylacidimicrobium sp. B4]|uniref:hypothetical protein n=1 Tax=Methylacidimicrobium sp. B4 TaxID=2796139 RepID=UPI001A8DCE40|nr:hypothetical protein [Methylacidimicrobium sp. B4]QSR83874.1 hypothetical protein MacB4_06200 [Methylacidimicrobium sp. B4]
MSSDPLDELLQSWRPEGRLPDEFQSEVWKRVALRSRIALTPIRLSRGTWATVLAASLFAFLLATGQVLRWEQERSAALRAQYFQSIDPQALAAAQEGRSP